MVCVGADKLSSNCTQFNHNKRKITGKIGTLQPIHPVFNLQPTILHLQCRQLWSSMYKDQVYPV